MENAERSMREKDIAQGYLLSRLGQDPHYGTLCVDLGKMNHPDYFGDTYYLMAGLRVRLEDDSGALLHWFVPLANTVQ
eukprot:1133833-Amphidinium_carterae.1